MTPQVFLLSDTLAGGGAERAISGMANYWARRDWRVSLATLSEPQVPDFYALDQRVRRLWLADGPVSGSPTAVLLGMLARLRRLRRLLEEARPDAAISFIHVPNILLLLASRGLPHRTVVSERGNPDMSVDRGQYRLAAHWRFLRRRLYRRAGAVTALNATDAAWIERECGVAVPIVPPAVRGLPEPEGRREPLVLGIGRLYRVKGFDLLVRSFAAACREYPAWRLRLIGSGPEEANLRRLAADAGIGGRFEIVTPVQDIERHMACAGIVALPSRSESFGNALLESMAMGAPVITTRCAGPESVVSDGENGRLVPIEDAGALTAALREMLADGLLRERLGRAALAVRERYAEERVMGLWETIALSAGAIA